MGVQLHLKKVEKDHHTVHYGNDYFITQINFTSVKTVKVEYSTLLSINTLTLLLNIFLHFVALSQQMRWDVLDCLLLLHAGKSFPSYTDHVINDFLNALLTSLVNFCKLKAVGPFNESTHLMFGLPLFLLTSTFPSIIVFFQCILSCHYVLKVQ